MNKTFKKQFGDISKLSKSFNVPTSLNNLNNFNFLKEEKTKGQILWGKVRAKFQCSNQLNNIMLDPKLSGKMYQKIRLRERKKRNDSSMKQINMDIRKKTALNQEKLTENTKLFNQGNNSVSCGPFM